VLPGEYWARKKKGATRSAEWSKPAPFAWLGPKSLDEYKKSPSPRAPWRAKDGDVSALLQGRAMTFEALQIPVPREARHGSR